MLAQSNPEMEVRITSYFGGSSADQLPFWFHSGQNGKFGQSKPAFGWIGLEGTSSYNIGQGIDVTAGLEGFLRQELSTHPVLNQWWVEFRKKRVRLLAGAKPETRGHTYRRLSSGSMGRSHNAAPVPKIGLDVDYVNLPYTNGFVKARGHIAHGWFEEDRYTSSPYLHEKSFYLHVGSGRMPVQMQAGLVHFAQFGGYTENYGQNPDGFSDFLRIALAKGGEEVSDVPGEWYALGNHIGIWDLNFDIDLKHFEINLYRQWIIETGKELLFNTPQDGLLGLGFRRADGGSAIDGVLWEFLYTKYQNGPHPAGKIPGKSGRKNYYNNVLYRSGWTYHGRTIGNPMLFPSQDESLTNGRRIANTRVVAHHFGLEGTVFNRISYHTMFTYSRNYGTYKNQEVAEKNGREYLFEGGAEQYSFFLNMETVLPVLNSPLLSVSVAIDRGEVHPVNIGLMLGFSWDILR